MKQEEPSPLRRGIVYWGSVSNNNNKQMTTPQEIIKEFEEQDFYLDIDIYPELSYGSALSENEVLIDKSKLRLALISTVIKQYEEVLGKIKNLEKPICRCMCEKNKITLAYNDCVFDTFSIIESKIREWKLIDNK